MDCPGAPRAASVPCIHVQGHVVHAPKLCISILHAWSRCASQLATSEHNRLLCSRHWVLDHVQGRGHDGSLDLEQCGSSVGCLHKPCRVPCRCQGQHNVCLYKSNDQGCCCGAVVPEA